MGLHPCKPLNPQGISAFDVATEANGYEDANVVVYRAGGEAFNPNALSILCDECGADAVWFQAQWFLRRIASRKTPPDKPTAYFIDCVRNDYSVDPTWPKSPLEDDAVFDRMWGPPGAVRAITEYDDSIPF
jgi:hypothetical protein